MNSMRPFTRIVREIDAELHEIHKCLESTKQWMEDAPSYPDFKKKVIDLQIELRFQSTGLLALKRATKAFLV